MKYDQWILYAMTFMEWLLAKKLQSIIYSSNSIFNFIVDLGQRTFGMPVLVCCSFFTFFS